mgnify:FL=1
MSKDELMAKELEEMLDLRKDAMLVLKKQMRKMKKLKKSL